MSTILRDLAQSPISEGPPPSARGGRKLDDEIVEVAEWDVLRVAPEVMRAFEAGPYGPRPRLRRGSEAERP